MTVLDWARRYVRNGLSVIPVRADGSKAPALAKGEVEQYRERFPTDAELQEWFAPHRAVGVAVVCGKQSGNLAVLDIESEPWWRAWLARVSDTPFAALLPHAIQRYAAVPMGITLIWLGAALWAERRSVLSAATAVVSGFREEAAN